MSTLKDLLLRLPASGLLICVGMAAANTSVVIGNSLDTNAPINAMPRAEVIGYGFATLLMIIAGLVILTPMLRMYLCPDHLDPVVERARAVYCCLGLMMTQAAMISSYGTPNLTLLVIMCLQIVFMINFHVASKETGTSSN